MQFSSVTQSCLTLCNPMDCRMPGLLVHHQLPEFTQTHVYWLGWWFHPTIQPCHPLLPPSPPTFNFFQHQGLFKWVSSSHQVAKVLEFQLQHQSSNEYSGLISFKMDWLDLLAVQQTPKSLLQHHSLKTKVLEFQLQHQSSNEYSGLISFKMDWLDLLAVQQTPKSLLQYHSSKASILQCSAFFITLTSIHDYWKNIALTHSLQSLSNSQWHFS